MRKKTILDKKVIDRLIRKYQTTFKKEAGVTISLRRKIHSVSTKICWKVENCSKVRQNNLFRNNQCQLHKTLGERKNMGQNQTPNPMEGTNFWSKIWSIEQIHNNGVSLLCEVNKGKE